MVRRARSLHTSGVLSTRTWLFDSRVATVAAAIVLAAVLTATSGEWAPAVVAVPALAFVVYGMVALTWRTGWVALG